MDKAYNFEEVENKLYRFWESEGFFKPEINPNGKPFSIVLPPPNVTGTLHMGHALMLVIEDVLVRYHRMKGYKTLWLPGTDHAAIATHAKVEAELWNTHKQNRFDLGREVFVRMVEEFAQNSHDTIANQIRHMGASVDWTREAYTLDEERNHAVRVAFKKMFDEGLIYRGAKIVNWDPRMQTTVSDDEVEWKEKESEFYYLQYGPFVIGTARPETKFGDKYVVMHPKDKRYTKYIHGDKIELEWINGKITATIIKDDSIDMEFGTGVMTITPWHDRLDFDIAEKHGLDKEQIIDFNGKLLPIAGEFKGLHIKKARPLIVEKLKAKNLLVKVDQKYIHNIATNSRGGEIIEPQVKEQWFISVTKEFPMGHSELKGIKKGEMVTLKQLMMHVVQSEQITFTPNNFIKTYYRWIENLRDWCISRQIWYGHRIPVWYKGTQVYCDIVPPKEEGWKQDPDTLDTWFSSGIWTFSSMGWPNETKDLKEFHPTSVLETGYDILFFWVARMILMTTYLRGEIPFKKVLLNGLVRDAQKQKMSKSKGNIINPLDYAKVYGTDALRIALIFSTAAGNDIALSEDRVRGMKYFSNKLWNIARFVSMHEVVDEIDAKSLDELIDHIGGEQKLQAADRQIIDILKKTASSVSENIESFRLHEATQTLYQFVWHDFADKYIEQIKKSFEGAEKPTENTYPQYQIAKLILIDTLKLLHPFMPYITEEIYLKIPGHGQSIMISAWPNAYK